MKTNRRAEIRTHTTKETIQTYRKLQHKRQQETDK